jgi:hypothetical protein
MLRPVDADVDSVVMLAFVDDKAVLRTSGPVPVGMPDSADATLVPRPDTPVEIGKPVALVRVTLAGVPNARPFGSDVEIDGTPAPVVTKTPLLTVARPVTAVPVVA